MLGEGVGGGGMKGKMELQEGRWDQERLGN